MINILVYGTLRKGGTLHHIMEHIGAKLIKVKTILGFEMYNMGWYPAVIKKENSIIEVEEYQIKNDDLKILDRVEGYPNLYQRCNVDNDHTLIYYFEDSSKVEERELIVNGKWKI